jgi:CRP-like cAMP-binding protein
LAGANKIIKKDQILFSAGDASDGMYIIRKGELLVYLEKGGAEVKLATLATGAMLGEMALFDKKPRSASARALTDTEITQISNEDFEKLMKQIPKWFVSLMSTLSSRLRDTNERLQTVESKNSGKAPPLSNLIKALHLLELTWHKDGVKDGKNWQLNRKQAQQNVAAVLEMPVENVHKIVDALVKGNLLSLQKDSYNAELLNMANRALLEKFLEFLEEYRANNPESKGPPKGCISLLTTLKGLVDASAYETLTLSFEEVCATGSKNGMQTENWKDSLSIFAKNKKGIVMTKVSSGVGFKITKAEYARCQSHYILLDALNSAGLT